MHAIQPKPTDAVVRRDALLGSSLTAFWPFIDDQSNAITEVVDGANLLFSRATLSWQESPWGWAAISGGSGDYLWANSIYNAMTPAITIAMLLRVNYDPPTTSDLLFIGATSGGRITISWDDGTNKIGAVISRPGKANIVVRDAIVHDGYFNDWHVIVLSFDDATGVAKLYVDGFQVGTTTGDTGALAYGSQAISIMGSPLSGKYTAGMINGVAIWSRPLSDADIVELSNDFYAPLRPHSQVWMTYPLMTVEAGYPELGAYAITSSQCKVSFDASFSNTPLARGENYGPYGNPPEDSGHTFWSFGLSYSQNEVFAVRRQTLAAAAACSNAARTYENFTFNPTVTAVTRNANRIYEKSSAALDSLAGTTGDGLYYSVTNVNAGLTSTTMVQRDIFFDANVAASVLTVVSNAGFARRMFLEFDSVHVMPAFAQTESGVGFTDNELD